MKNITININHITELFPIDKKDFLEKKGILHLWEKVYDKGESIRFSWWLPIKTGRVAKEDMYRQLFSGRFLPKSQVQELIKKEYSEEGIDYTEFLMEENGVLYYKPHILLSLVNGSEYKIFYDTYQQCEDYISNLKKGREEFRTITVA